jgi:alanyl-tRNA synthetase
MITMNLDEITANLPKTELLCLRQMDLLKAQANVIRVVPEKRTQAYLVLDKTVFHPKGGGQPSDRGTITCDQFTLDVKKAIFHNGVVVHWAKIVSGIPSTTQVSCDVDWVYREMIMRRHTAAHLIDHCLAKATARRVETTDSWLDEPCYVGYRGEPPAPDTVRQVDDLANSMITQGAQVRIEFLTREQSKSVLEDAPNFERLPDLEEIRTVTIEGCQPIPCGGTHVRNIRQIGKLSALKAEERDDGSFRLHFTVVD